MNCYKQLIAAIKNFKGPDHFVVTAINDLVSKEEKEISVSLERPRDVRDLLHSLNVCALS